MARKYISVLSLLLAVAMVASASNVPLLLWSSSSSFAGQRQYHSESLTGKDIRTVFDSLVSGSSSNGLFNLESKPELIVVFVQPKASSAQIARLAAYEPLKATFASAAASVAATHVNVEHGEIVAALDAAAASVAGRVVRASASALPDLAELSQNGVTDLVIITVDASASAAAKTVADISKALKSFDFVAVFTAEESAEVQQTWAEPIKPVWSKRYTLANDSAPVGAPINVSAPVANEDNQPGFGDYFPPWFWEGFVFGFLFVWIAICGTCQLMDMQAPDRYLADDGKKKKME